MLRVAIAIAWLREEGNNSVLGGMVNMMIQFCWSSTWTHSSGCLVLAQAPGSLAHHATCSDHPPAKRLSRGGELWTIGVVLCKSLAALMDISSGHSHCFALTRGGKPRIGWDGEYDDADCDGGDVFFQNLKKMSTCHPLIPSENCKK